MTMRSRPLNLMLATAALAWFALALQACGANVQCGEGTVAIDGVCFPIICGPGTAPQGNTCVVSTEVCTPSCPEGIACGTDGCGGSCGTCDDPAAPFCVLGRCTTECTPSCEGRSCGDDGCGGTCGECGGGTTCADLTGQCVANTWTCNPNAFGDGSWCDCACGETDPDCTSGEDALTVRGCENVLATCDANNACEGGFDPDDWSCDPRLLSDGSTCDCGCGIPDPDCLDGDLPLTGCADGESCNPDGTCAACVPQCDGRQCGPDGCGGSCGACTELGASFCNPDGTCTAMCVPQCEGRACGPDGCGGECGACADGQTCQTGVCVVPDDSESCEDRCGGIAPSGCSCEATCAQEENCCPDVFAVCGCQPICDGKSCGDDGCGGTCGTCEQGARCDEASQCVDDPCDPDPCNGQGTCDPTSGACTCLQEYTGVACDECSQGRVDYPNCTPDPCTVFTCSAHGVCDPLDGSCTCFGGFDGTNCDRCAPGKGTYPNCMP